MFFAGFCVFAHTTVVSDALGVENRVDGRRRQQGFVRLTTKRPVVRLIVDFFSDAYIESNELVTDCWLYFDGFHCFFLGQLMFDFYDDAGAKQNATNLRLMVSVRFEKAFPFVDCLNGIRPSY
jgi:hypothetical protein